MDTPAVEPAVPVAQDAPAPAPVEGQAPAQAEAESIDALPEWAKKHIKELRGESAKYRKTAKEIEAAQVEAQRKSAEEQGKFKELYEREMAEKEKLSLALREVELNTMRSKAAKAAGLPDEFAERLKGDTDEAMLEDARALAAIWRKSNPQTVNNDARNGLGGKAPNTLDIAGAAKRFNLPSALKALEKAG